MSGSRFPVPWRIAPNDGISLARRRSPIIISIPEKPRAINPRLFPEGVCNSCQKITLQALLNTNGDSRDEDELYWLDYDRNLPTDCPMCKIVFSSFARGNEIIGRIQVGLSVDDRKPEKEIQSGREIRRILIRKCYGGNAHIAGGGSFRIYAKPGVQIFFCEIFVFAFRSDSL